MLVVNAVVAGTAALAVLMAMRTARGAVVPAPTVLAHNGRDILPDLVAVAATASLALLLLAGDAPVGQGAATFALGATGVLLVATVYRVVLRVQAARRVRVLPSDLLAAVAERLRALRDEPSPAALDRLASALAVIGGVHAPAVTSAVSLAQVGRAVVARTRPLAAARRVVVTLTVEDDAWSARVRPRRGARGARRARDPRQPARRRGRGQPAALPVRGPRPGRAGRRRPAARDRPRRRARARRGVPDGRRPARLRPGRRARADCRPRARPPRRGPVADHLSRREPARGRGRPGSESHPPGGFRPLVLHGSLRSSSGPCQPARFVPRPLALPLDRGRGVALWTGGRGVGDAYPAPVQAMRTPPRERMGAPEDRA